MTARLRFLGVAGVELVSPGGTRVVIDPCLSGDDTTGLAPSPVRADELTPDLVLVSHGADDHYGDAPAIVLSAGAFVGCAPDVRLRLLQDGVPPEQIVKLLPGVRRAVGDVVVLALHANHISFHVVDGAWVSGPPLCFIVDLGGIVVFHAGDTALFSDLRMIGELYAPELALLPIGATERGVEFMPPADAAIALEWLGAPLAVPMHYPPDSAAADAFEAAVVARDGHARVVHLQPGESMELTERR